MPVDETHHPTSAKAQSDMYVAKDNDIIRHSRYTLSVQEQRVLLYMISLIRPHDEPSQRYTFSIADFAATAGLEVGSGYYYARVKDILWTLGNAKGDVQYYDEIGKKHTRPFTWLSHDATVINDNDGTVTIGFGAAVQPYLYNLRDHYTQYKLVDVLFLRSKYAIRLYQVLKSYVFKTNYSKGHIQQVTYTIDQIKSLLDAQTYDKYKDLKARVLVPSVKEINTKCQQIHIEMTQNKRGNKVIDITFAVDIAHSKQITNVQQQISKKIENKSVDKTNYKKVQYGDLAF